MSKTDIGHLFLNSIFAKNKACKIKITNWGFGKILF